MSNKKRTVSGVIFLGVLLVAAYVIYGGLSGNFAPSPQDSRQQDKFMSTDFLVQDIGGSDVRLSDFYGKPIVLNFWASWCSPCKGEMPEFNQVYNDYNGEIVFLMINQTDGSRETLESASNYVKSQGFTFPVYYDTKLEAAYLYNVTAIPTTYFIDNQGYIVSEYKGSMSREQLLNKIEEIK